MAAETAPWLQFDFGENGGKVTFKDKNTFLDFAQREINFYQWTEKH